MIISKIIKRHGMTIAEVAEKMGTTPASLSNLISPKRNITADNMRKIAAAIGCNVSEFWEDEDTLQSFPKSTIICPKCGARLKVVEDGSEE